MATGIEPSPTGSSRQDDRRDGTERGARFTWRRGLLPAAVIGIALITAFALIGDAQDLADAFRAFDWWLIGPILALTIWNYGWRFAKWQMYLRHLDVRLPVGLSLRIFLGGFAMSLTPGKVGELIKSVYIRRFTGAPINRTSAVVAAERMTDAIAMLILAAIGATRYDYGRPFLLVVAFFGAGGVLLLQRPAVVQQLIDRSARTPVLRRAAVHGRAFVEASGTLFRPNVLLRAVGLGIVSWSGECAAFFLVLIGLGIDSTFGLLLIAIFVLAVSSLAGGASLVPGGLGVADAGIAGLLVLLVTDDAMTGSVAAAATILIRFSTLWFAVILGGVALWSLERQWGRAETPGLPVQSLAQADREQLAPEETPPVGLEAVRDGGDQ